MLYLYLDESGDLGFDFVNKKPSSFFTICVLALKGHQNDRAMATIVRAVVRRKLNRRTAGQLPELKGSSTTIEVKRFFYSKLQDLDFKLYSVTLNKKRFYDSLINDKERVYNYLARLALEKVDFKDAAVRVIMTVDRSKSKQAIFDFNNYVIGQIKAALDPLVPLSILHVSSHESPGLQAADMFAWGIFRKYEKSDSEWIDVFKGKLRFERLYLP